LAQRNLWDKLSTKEKRSKVNPLYHLSGAYVVCPKGFMFDMEGSSKKPMSSSETDTVFNCQLTVTFKSIDSPAASAGSLVLGLRKSGSAYDLSVQGSGLFLLQGNTDYALPNNLKALAFDPKTPLEIQLLTASMLAPFSFLSGLAKAAHSLPAFGAYVTSREYLPSISTLVQGLELKQIRLNGFTVTRYQDFSNFGSDTPPSELRQTFLASLFLIYDAAKPSSKGYMNNGMRSYKGISAETRFVDEAYLAISDQDEQPARRPNRGQGFPHTQR
jgi:hypothetical protein